MELLERALQAEGAERVALLEQAWRGTPHPDIADLLFTADPADFGLLGEGLEATEARIRSLAERDDPRVGAAQAAFLAALPFTSDGSKPMWTAFFEGLTDPRFADIGGFAVRPSMAGWLENRAAEVRARLSDATLPQAPPAELIERLRAALGPPRDEGLLLAAVWANPEDDGPRAVYADWLTERGDPRGAFITLQLAGEEKKAKKLLKGNELAWAGPIAGAIAKKGLVYERGFVARANTAFKQPKVAQELGEHPAWATLVEIAGVHTAWEYGKSHHTNTISPAFRSVRIVRGFGWGGVEKLIAGDAWPIEHLEVRADLPETTDALQRLDTLPALRTLVLSGIRHGLGWLWGCPFMATLEHLSVDQVDPELVAQAERRSSIRTLTLRYGRGGGTVTYHRGPDGRFGEPIVDGPDPEPVLAVLSGERAPVGQVRRPFGMDLSPDGSTLAVAWGSQVRFLDAATLEELRVFEDVQVYHLVRFSPDGARVAAWGQDMRVVVVDVATARVVARHRSRMGIDDVTWLQDGRLASVRPLTVAGEERKASGWCLCAVPDGWIALGDQGRVLFAPADGKAKRAPLQVGTGVVRALAWRDGRLVVGLGSSVVAMEGHDRVWEAHLEQRVGSIRALPDGRWLVRCTDTFLLDAQGTLLRKIPSRDGGTYISGVVVRGDEVIVAREDGIRQL